MTPTPASPVAGPATAAVRARIEAALAGALGSGEAHDGPPQLAAALRHAVLGGGARVRPQLCLAVAAACGDDAPALSEGTAAALELLHCASLVHDDLPCFDDADTRRGRPSVHRAYGERIAVLAGDALIVLAFQVLADASVRTARPHRLAPLVRTVCAGVGVPHGIVAGQAFECEPQADLARYHREKTGALFAAATMAGALAAGADPRPWRAFGEWLGAAYQVADDIRDACAEEGSIGKPAGRDAALGRPSVVRSLGLREALRRFHGLVDACCDAVPEGPGAAALRALARSESERLVPKAWSLELERRVA